MADQHPLIAGLDPNMTWTDALAHTLARVLEVAAELDVHPSVGGVFEAAEHILQTYRKVEAHEARLVDAGSTVNTVVTAHPATPEEFRLRVIQGGKTTTPTPGGHIA